MKILFLADWNIEANSGVLDKIHAQVLQWSKNGHEIHLWFISAFTNQNALPEGLENVIVFEADTSYIFLHRKFRLFLGRAFAYRKIRKQIQRLKPDLIYYRQGMWYPYLCSVLKKSRTVMELNTDDLSETQFMSKINKIVYLLGRKRIIKYVNAFVSVTDEIKSRYSQYNKPIATITNSIDLAGLPVIKRIPHQKPHLFFVGSPGQAWHGVDKIVQLAALLPEFNFSIAGPNTDDVPPDIVIPINVTFLGYLTKDRLWEVYKTVDVAIGTIALHRKKMEEACPLKTREYVGLGFPVILGYKDTDLHNSNGPVLQLPNTEDNVITSINEIRDFVENNLGKQWPDDQKKKIDLVEKEKQRLDFFASLLTRT